MQRDDAPEQRGAVLGHGVDGRGGGVEENLVVEVADLAEREGQLPDVLLLVREAAVEDVLRALQKGYVPTVCEFTRADVEVLVVEVPPHEADGVRQQALLGANARLERTGKLVEGGLAVNGLQQLPLGLLRQNESGAVDRGPPRVVLVHLGHFGSARANILAGDGW